VTQNTSKRNLSSSSSSSLTKNNDKISKVFATPNRYASLSEDTAFYQVFSPSPDPPIAISSQDQCNIQLIYVKSSPNKFSIAPPYYLSKIVHSQKIISWSYQYIGYTYIKNTLKHSIIYDSLTKLFGSLILCIVSHIAIILIWHWFKSCRKQ
jgi:hypothetical protein